MNDYRQRLEERGYIGPFEAARIRKDQKAMGSILCDAGFAPLEIESILWAKGDIGSAPTQEEKKRKIVDEIIGRVGVAVFSGLFLGGVFVYFSSGLADADSRGEDGMDVLMKDYRDPSEAYYRPFVLGFAIGGVLGLVAGSTVIDAVLQSRRRRSEADIPR